MEKYKNINNKQFHIIQFDDKYSFQDYNNKFKYYIVKILIGEYLELKISYHYTDENNWKYHNEKIQIFNLDHFKILYSDDRLFKCIDQLKIIDAATKYNL